MRPTVPRRRRRTGAPPPARPHADVPSISAASAPERARKDLAGHGRTPGAQRSRSEPERPGYIASEKRRLDPAAGATPATENDHPNPTRPSVDVELVRLADPDYLRAVTHDLFGPQPPKHTP